MTYDPQGVILGYTAAPGLAIYGDGSDGDLTLSSDTVLADGVLVKRYTTLNVGGYTLSGSDQITDYSLFIFCSVGLVMNGGKINSCGAAGGSGGAGGTWKSIIIGNGGNGGGPSRGLWVFARKITVTGACRIESSNDGTDAQDSTGTVNPLDTNGMAPYSAGSVAGILNYIYHGTSVAATRPTAGDRSDAWLDPGLGGNGGRAGSTIYAQSFKNIIRLMNLGGVALLSADTRDQCQLFAGDGSGGGTGCTILDQTNCAHGQSGGGGGGAGWLSGANPSGGDGGDGVAPGTYSGAPGGSGGGSGGGGGGAGCFCFVACEEILGTGTLIVSAKGGDGGDGGDSTTSTLGYGGPGGGGGEGGCAVYLGPASTSVTVTAAGGSAGVSGSGIGGSDAAVAGIAGIGMYVPKDGS